MKNILVATDFSATADKAVTYAVELAKKTNSSLVLFHAYMIPVPVTEVPVIVVSGEELEKSAIAGLERVKKTISAISPSIPVQCVVKVGVADERIGDVVRETKCDLVIMGMHGSGKLEEYLVGSNTSGYIRRAAVPVLVIPEKAVFSVPDKIAFAWDYKGEMNANLLKPLFDFVKLFKSKLLVVNILNEPEEVSVQKASAGIKLERLLEAVDHTLHFPVKEQSITDEINYFVKEHQAGLLAVIPHKHGIAERVFNKSNTKKMVFHANVPLLAIPEQKS